MENENIVDKLIGELERLQRHIEMLKATKENQPIGIIRLSEILDMPKHKVRYSLRLLEKDGLIIPSPEGAMVSDDYEAYMKELSAKLKHIVEMIDNLQKVIPLS